MAITSKVTLEGNLRVIDVKQILLGAGYVLTMGTVVSESFYFKKDNLKLSLTSQSNSDHKLIAGTFVLEISYDGPPVSLSECLNLVQKASTQITSMLSIFVQDDTDELIGLKSLTPFDFLNKVVREEDATYQAYLKGIDQSFRKRSSPRHK